MNLGDINFNKKDVKVKSFVRKGKLVKSYKKRIDVKTALTGLAGGALGAGAIGTAFVLGRGKGIKEVTNLIKNNADDIAAKVLSKLPKQQVQTVNTKEIANEVLSRLPKQQQVQQIDSTAIIKAVEDKISRSTPVIDTKAIADDVIARLPKQSTTVNNVDTDSIIKAVEDRVARSNKQLLSDIDNKLANVAVNSRVVTSNSGNSNNVKEIVADIVQIDRVPLPSKINNISPKTQTKLEQLAQTKSDAELENLIQKETSRINQFVELESKRTAYNSFNKYVGYVKNPDTIPLTAFNADKKGAQGIPTLTIEDLTVNIRSLREKLGLPRRVMPDIEGGNVIPKGYIQPTPNISRYIPKLSPDELEIDISPDDLEYLEKVRKLNTRHSKIKDIYNEEVRRRAALNKKVITEADTDDAVSRLQDFLDDFSYNTFPIINFRSPICLGDIVYV